MKQASAEREKRIHRINGEIRSKWVRLLDESGEQKGILALSEALEMASKANQDLVEINPKADPPVCRLVNYSKFLYQRNKLLKEQRKRQKNLQIKEIKFRPNTEINDYQIKLKSILRFIEAGDKVKITLRFKGREVIHQKIGFQLLERLKKDTSEIAVVESFPSGLEGRQAIMLLAPKKIGGPTR